MKHISFILILLAALPAARPAAEAPAAAPQPVEPALASGLSMKDDLTVDAPRNLLADIPAKTKEGLVNALVEIPTGSNAKWEVKDDGVLHWDMKDGKPRVVKYLSYVGNYGMVPSTRQGDGDPIDILVLAPAYPRGSVVPVRVIGAMLFTDKGEQDDKLLAVAPGTPLGAVTNMAELDEQFPGVTDIVRIWFERYKGAGNKMEFKGKAEAEQAIALLEASEKNFPGADSASAKP